MKVIAKQSFYDSENRTKRRKGEEFTVSARYFKALPDKLLEEVIEKPKKKRQKKVYKTKEEKVNLDDKKVKES